VGQRGGAESVSEGGYIPRRGDLAAGSIARLESLSIEGQAAGQKIMTASQIK